jgi:hypothetical protein
MNVFKDVFTRFFELGSLIAVDLPADPYPEKEIAGFIFRPLGAADIPAVGELCLSRSDKYFESYRQKLLTPERNIGFAFIDTATQRIAYTRWVLLDHFFSDIIHLRRELKKDEALTLDSYTHPDYRFRGLHREANARMLNWLKRERDIRRVYAVERWFNPHIKKVTRSLGYRRKNIRIRYKQGSLGSAMKKVVRAARRVIGIS